jgi:ankyrin repeat protein
MTAPLQAAFFDACRRNDRCAAEALLREDPQLLHSADPRGFTPLILAVYNDAPDVTELLLSSGADPDAQDAAGNTALMGVCFKGYPALFHRLLEAGASVHIRNGNGATALTFAATFGHIGFAEALLQRGASVLVPDARGKTPLDHAAIQENEPMVELLARYLPAESARSDAFLK